MTDGVIYAEFVGVQHEAGDFYRIAFGISVDRIAEDGEAQGLLHVDADLMGAAGVQVAFDMAPGIVLGRVENAVVGDGVFAAGRLDIGHALTVDGMSGDVGFYGAGIDNRLSHNDASIDFPGCSGGELGGEGEVGDVGFCGDQTAGGVAVEAMHDTGPLWIDGVLGAAKFGELACAVMQQCVDQSAGRIAGAGVDDEAAGFVDDDQVFVFVENVEGDIFRGGQLGSRAGGAELKRDDFPAVQQLPTGCGCAVEANFSVFYKPLQM